jgi:hypothetical protein
MANPITDFLTGGISGVVNSISEVIGKFVANPEEKLKAQVELSRIATDFQVKAMEVDRDFAVQQATVITAEAKSESWLARNWRPLIMIEFGFIIGYNYILAPIFGIQSLPIVPDMWSLLKLGMGGYIIGRSAEKTIPQVVEALKK